MSAQVCELCEGAPATTRDRRADTLDRYGNSWEGLGTRLCERCEALLDTMPDGEALQELLDAQGRRAFRKIIEALPGVVKIKS